MKFKIFLFSFLFILNPFIIAKNFQTEGNLEALNPADCVEVDKLGNQKNPAEIFIGIKKCIQLNKNDTAAKLFLVALSYGKFDTLRVKDKTAHQAIGVLRVNLFSQLNAEQIKAFQKSFKIAFADASSCKSIISLGRPNYHPTYMLQHGMSAFTSTGGGLQADFNANSAWQTVIKDYLKCSD